MSYIQWKTVEILFFGAGKIGHYWLERCRELGMVPKGILDNDRALCGSLYEGVRVYHVDNLRELTFDAVFITCGKAEEIHSQLLALGVSENAIVSGSYNLFNHLLYFAVAKRVIPFSPLVEGMDKSELFLSERKILFDLRNGMVLGGVEAWVYDLAKKLKERGYKGLYLVADEMGPKVRDTTFPIQELHYRNVKQEKDKVELCMKKIMENMPCTVVCNFPQNIFWAACIVKSAYPDLVRIVAVQHSDEQIFYETYCLWQRYIDTCLAISSHIEKYLLLSGMEQGKIGRLGWKVVCEKQLDRTWSTEKQCLQIGYAGRITVTQKRVDLLLLLATKLKSRGISFHVNIAGAGNYDEQLKQRILEENLQQNITMMGYIVRHSIPSFWKSQDIMVSCSEWEGHSISQQEAMAAGAVPVITDVSGARDDVEDEYNGYVVPVGDLDMLADRICHLYYHRELLEKMGERSHQIILKQNTENDVDVMWNRILKDT